MSRALISIFLISMSYEAFGCAACGFGDDGTREAFLFTTALMTLIPLIMIGGGVAYLMKRARKINSEVEEVPQTHPY